MLISLFWKFLERGGTQGIQFLVTLVLARLLEPRDYGAIALATVFLSLAVVLAQSGFQTALVQKQEIDELDYSSVFFLNLSTSTVLYGVLFFVAPLCAEFFREPALVSILRVLGISLFFGAITGLQTAKATRDMAFKHFFFSSIGALVVSGPLGVYMALAGYGVWALVWQQLVSGLVTMLILWVVVKWRPTLRISLSRLGELFRYGWKLLATSLVDVAFNNLYNLVIGRVYSTTQLGYFNRGNSIPSILISNINASIQSVIFPVLSRIQHDRDEVKRVVRRAVISSSYLVIPLMVWLAASAKTVILLILTENWLGAVPFLQISCFVFLWWPIHTANLQALSALGRTDLVLKLEVAKKILMSVVAIATSFFGVHVFAAGLALTSFLSMPINAWPNRLLIGYSFWDQFRDILPILLLSGAMGTAVLLVGFLAIDVWFLLLLQVLVGVGVYIGAGLIWKLEGQEYLFGLLRKFVRRKG